MRSCLQIGQHQLDVDQIMTALIRYRMLETLVGQTLLDETTQAVTLSSGEIVAALGGDIDLLEPEEVEPFIRKWCHDRNITGEYFQGVILRELRIEKFKRLNFADQVESEFLRIQSDLDRVEYSWLQLDDRTLAQELYFQLRDDGVTFADLSRAQGQAWQAGEGQGPVPLSSLPVEVALVFRQGGVGQVSGPLEIADRLWIVRLDHFEAARLTAATRTDLMNALYNRWLQAQIKALLAQPGAIGVGTIPDDPVPESLVPAENPIPENPVPENPVPENSKTKRPVTENPV